MAIKSGNPCFWVIHILPGKLITQYAKNRLQKQVNDVYLSGCVIRVCVDSLLQLNQPYINLREFCS